jgi:hypothetical protein
MSGTPVSHTHWTHTGVEVDVGGVRPHRHARRATFRLALGRQVYCTVALLPLCVHSYVSTSVYAALVTSS